MRTLHGHKTEIYRLTLLPDLKTLATGGKDGAVYLWDVQSGKHPSGATSVPEPVWEWSFSSDGQSVVAVGKPDEVAAWSGHRFQEKRALFPLRNLSFNARPSLRFSGDARALAIGFVNGTVQVWDVARRTLLTEVKIGTGPCYPEFFFAGNNRLVSYESRSKTYYDVDLPSGRILASWEGLAHGGSGIMAAMSPDEARCLAVGMHDGEAVMRDMASGKVTRVGVQAKEIKSPAFSPDGRLIAAPSASPGGVILWEAATLRELAQLTGFLQGCHSVAFSPDNGRLAVGGTGLEALTLWDPESRHRLLTLPATGSMYVSTTFSSDGNVLGSSNAAGTLSFWHAPSWHEIAEAEKAQAAWIYRPTPAVKKVPAPNPKSSQSKAGTNPVRTDPPTAKNAAPTSGPSAPSGTPTNVATPATPAGQSTATTAAEVTDESSRLSIALKTLAIRKQSLGPEDPNTLVAMSNVGIAYFAERKYAEAAAMHRETLELRKRVLGPEHASTLWSMNSLGITLGALGQLRDAADLLTQTVELRKRVSGAEDVETLRSMKNLASVHRSQRKYAEAAALTKDVLEIEQRTLGADAPATLSTMHDLGVHYQLQGKLPESAAQYLDTLALQDRALGPEHSLTIQTMENLSGILLSLQRFAEAEPLCRRLVEARAKSEIAWRTAFARSKLGEALRGLQRYSEAEPLLVAAFDELVKDASSIPVANRSIIRSAGTSLVRLHTDWNQPEKAAEWKQKLDAISPPAPAKSSQKK